MHRYEKILGWIIGVLLVMFLLGGAFYAGKLMREDHGGDGIEMTRFDEAANDDDLRVNHLGASDEQWQAARARAAGAKQYPDGFWYDAQGNLMVWPELAYLIVTQKQQRDQFATNVQGRAPIPLHCQTDQDCALRDAGSCRGAYLRCVRQDALIDLAHLVDCTNKRCARGEQKIKGCRRENGSCVNRYHNPATDGEWR